MKIHNISQRSEAWYRIRTAIPTASNFKRIVTPKKWEPSEQAKGYLHELLAEWILGRPLDRPQTTYMIHGQENEDQAVATYEFQSERETNQAGFFTTDDGLIGCSPDRLVGEDGLLEIKVSQPHIHVGYMLTHQIELEHAPQLQGQLWLTGRQWVDIVSYCEAGLPTVVIRVLRDEEKIKKLSAAVQSFSDTNIACRVRLEQQYGPFVRIERNTEPTDADPGPLGISDEDVAMIADRYWPQEITNQGVA